MKYYSATTINNDVERVEKLAEENEAYYNLFCGLLIRARADSKAVKQVGWVESEKGIEFFGMQSAIDYIVISEGSIEAATLFANRFDLSLGRPLSVVGSPEVSQKVAEVFAGRSGLRAKHEVSQMIYSIDRVQSFGSAKGACKTAVETDFDLLVRWQKEFILEAVPNDVWSEDRIRTTVRTKINDASMFIWECDGEAVSMAGAARTTKNGVAIGPVYTPKVQRSMGYGMSLTAAVTQRQFDLGKKFVALYTDLSNPTSNSIYKKIGYKEVGPSAQYLIV